MAALAEVTTVVAELRRFVAQCRADPSARAQLTPADLAQAKALLAEARRLLAHARRSASLTPPTPRCTGEPADTIRMNRAPVLTLWAAMWPSGWA